MKQLKTLFVLLANVLLSLQAFSQTQTVRGVVFDESSGLPLPGTLVFLKTADAGATLATTADSLGRYRLEKVPVGRQTVQAQLLGYGSALLPGLLVETGKEFILEISLREQPSQLGEVVVKAPGKDLRSDFICGGPMLVEEQFRFPATYYDPARLAMSMPGVVGADDQGNSLSVRGNSPAFVRWRLEGADIVNPNHTANAGTFSDRPTAAGGGVNILSAQLLGISYFLTGAFPAGYGNALGGILDMYFRNGNNERHEFTVQASVIGLEAAAEGPLGVAKLSAKEKRNGKSTNKGQGREASYLVNYRYSFVGLLTAAGADFGGEEISFQDLSFRLNFPVMKNAELGFFGMGGLSRNLFRSPLEADKIKEEKDLFNIHFQSKMGATGLTFKKNLKQKTRLQAAVVWSGLQHERISDKVANVNQPIRWGDDETHESKLVFSGKIVHKITPIIDSEIGMQASREQTGFRYFFTDNIGQYHRSGNTLGWLVQPFFNAHIYLSKKIKTDVGIHLHHFTQKPVNTAILPRISLTYFPKYTQQISIGYGGYAQIQQPTIFASEQLPGNETGTARSRQANIAFQQVFGRGISFRMEVYHQHLYHVPVSARMGSTFSVLNNIEDFNPLPDTLANTGKGRNYGMDIWVEKPIAKHVFTRLGGSLYRSLYTDYEGVERPTRFDGRYLLTASFGREKAKQKSGKTAIIGQSIRLTWYGGFRQTPVDSLASAVAGRTVFDDTQTNAIELMDYYRLDLRFYWKRNKPKYSSTFSIDIQNATNRKNDAYLYFDQVQQQVKLRKQLGLLPLMAYRVEFGR